MAINASGDDGGVETATETVEKPPAEPRRFEVFDGHPLPFGATARDGGVNFSVVSGNATSATLCLISRSDLPQVNFVLFFWLFKLVK